MAYRGFSVGLSGAHTGWRQPGAALPVLTTSASQCYGNDNKSCGDKHVKLPSKPRFQQVTVKQLAIVDKCNGNKFVIANPTDFFAAIAGPNSPTPGVPAGVILYRPAAKSCCGKGVKKCCGGSKQAQALAAPVTLARGAAPTTLALTTPEVLVALAQGYDQLKSAKVCSNASATNPLSITFYTVATFADGTVGTTVVATSGAITVSTPNACVPLALPVEAPVPSIPNASGVQLRVTLSAPGTSGGTGSVIVNTICLSLCCGDNPPLPPVDEDSDDDDDGETAE